ncbi:MAG: tRNA (5-methylaminomethyl-2-thiouridine)(34)-methyltransferase MnmD, partial [Pseudomonadota bacterium]|nr:tRNA (5-methylaminomethyl-2-thiouridine)(34)-methyltransferase MnmD [Pseudomonadota bacterium]
MTDSDQPLRPAELEWQDGVPSSTRFGDIYFNRAGGVAETRHVFLQGNALEERFSAPGRAPFVVAETGFGTGLNFLCCRELWLQRAASRRQLHYISCEKYPLSPADLERALANFVHLRAGARQLLDYYPAPVAGVYNLEFDAGRILLTLLFGDARECLSQLDARVDAWFLDGFAPARNPELWQEPLFNEIARLSGAGSSFATFTAAGAVRRGLQAVGFEVTRRAGFGSKREMLTGR